MLKSLSLRIITVCSILLPETAFTSAASAPKARETLHGQALSAMTQLPAISGVASPEQFQEALSTRILAYLGHGRDLSSPASPVLVQTAEILTDYVTGLFHRRVESSNKLLGGDLLPAPNPLDPAAVSVRAQLKSLRDARPNPEIAAETGDLPYTETEVDLSPFSLQSHTLFQSETHRNFILWSGNGILVWHQSPGGEWSHTLIPAGEKLKWHGDWSFSMTVKGEKQFRLFANGQWRLHSKNFNEENFQWNQEKNLFVEALPATSENPETECHLWCFSEIKGWEKIHESPQPAQYFLSPRGESFVLAEVKDGTHRFVFFTRNDEGHYVKIKDAYLGSPYKIHWGPGGWPSLVTEHSYSKRLFLLNKDGNWQDDKGVSLHFLKSSVFHKGSNRVHLMFHERAGAGNLWYHHHYLYAMDSEGRWKKYDAGHGWGLQFSPDQRQFFIFKQLDPHGYEIWGVDKKNHWQNISQGNVEATYNTHVHWSPAGNALLVTNYDMNRPSKNDLLYLVDGKWVKTRLESHHYHPGKYSFSPDGQTLILKHYVYGQIQGDDKARQYHVVIRQGNEWKTYPVVNDQKDAVFPHTDPVWSPDSRGVLLVRTTSSRGYYYAGVVDLSAVQKNGREAAIQGVSQGQLFISVDYAWNEPGRITLHNRGATEIFVDQAFQKVSAMSNEGLFYNADHSACIQNLSRYTRGGSRITYQRNLLVLDGSGAPRLTLPLDRASGPYHDMRSLSRWTSGGDLAHLDSRKNTLVFWKPKRQLDQESFLRAQDLIRFLAHWGGAYRKPERYLYLASRDYSVEQGFLTDFTGLLADLQQTPEDSGAASPAPAGTEAESA